MYKEEKISTLVFQYPKSVVVGPGLKFRVNGTQKCLKTADVFLGLFAVKLARLVPIMVDLVSA